MLTRSLAKLRSWLKNLKATATTGRDPNDIRLDYVYLFQADGSEDQIEIEEEEFFAAKGDECGHPMPGVYTVRVVNESGDTVDTQSGAWLVEKELTEKEAEERKNDPAGIAKASRVSVENSVYDSIRYRKAAIEAEETLTKVIRERNAYAQGQMTLSQEIVVLKTERDQAVIARDEAIIREQAREEELKALEAAGGELALPMQESTRAGINQVLKRVGIGDPLHEEKESILEELVSQVGPLLRLVHEGVISWDAARTLLEERYGYEFDPEEPPAVDWRPGQEEKAS